MLVKQIMKTDVAACTAGQTLADVARLMRDRNCGFVPVVNSEGRIAGVVTDRDLGLAVGVSTRAAERISATEVMSQPVVACFADENVKAVLATMAKHHVRRLPVLDKQHGHLIGVLSIDDVAVLPRRHTLPTGDEIADALKHIVLPSPMTEVPS